MDLDFNPDGSLLAIGPSEQQKVILLDVVRNEVAAVLEEPLMTGIGSVRFSPDGTHLLVGGTGIAVTLWDVKKSSPGRYWQYG